MIAAIIRVIPPLLRVAAARRNGKVTILVELKLPQMIILLQTPQHHVGFSRQAPGSWTRTHRLE